MNLFATETVTVISTDTELDDLGEPISSTPTETAVQVIVQPGLTESLDETRPEGVSVEYTLHFPKTWTAPLRGCFCLVRGERFAVIGDPKPYTPANTPGGYNLTVEVTRTDG